MRKWETSLTSPHGDYANLGRSPEITYVTRGRSFKPQIWIEADGEAYIFDKLAGLQDPSKTLPGRAIAIKKLR
jgi:hypothetical protein